jgi:hypothetical protein
MTDTAPRAQPDATPPIGCEVQDWVLYPDATVAYRTQHEAANVELERRGQPELVAPSGEVSPYGLMWMDTCGGTWLELEGVTAWQYR